jgi:hypothetical protein
MLPPGVDSNTLPASVAATISGTRPGRVVLQTHEPLEILAVLSSWAREHGYALADIDVHRPTLEETYLRLTEHAK